MNQPAQRLPHVTPAQVAWVSAVLRWLQALSPRLAARLAFWLFLRPQRRGLAPADAAIMANARVHHLVAGADMVRVYEWGSGARTALIAHGWGSRASRFAPLATALAARGWRVLAFDAPGHGLSPGRSSSLPQFMATMDAVAAQLGSPTALIGHSLGALAIVCARAAGTPALFSSLQKIVLISPPSGAPFLVDSFHRMFGIGAATGEHLQRYFSRRFRTTPATFVANPPAAIAGLPALVVHDREDDIVPLAHGEALLSALPRARLLATQGLGHSALTRDAQTIEAIADFLDRETP